MAKYTIYLYEYTIGEEYFNVYDEPQHKVKLEEDTADDYDRVLELWKLNYEAYPDWYKLHEVVMCGGKYATLSLTVEGIEFVREINILDNEYKAPPIVGYDPMKRTINDGYDLPF